MEASQFIDELAAGNASGAKDILNDMLSARAFEALEGRKVEIAQNIFNGSQVQEESVEQVEEGTMTGITLGAKVKNKQGGYNQDVHHKGEKIGHIEAYKHRTGMRYGAHHDASGDATAGNRDAEESIADIRYSHAEHLRSMKKQQEEVEITQEEFDQLDEISKKTATSAYVARMGREDDKSPDKAVKTMDRIYKKHGATGVMRAATAADKKYGIHSADYTKKDFVGDYLSSKGK
jgi:hypothetical protein